MRSTYGVFASGILLATILAVPTVRSESLGEAQETLPPRIPKQTVEGRSEIARDVVLNIPAGSYFSGTEGQKLLKYLVRCALDADTRATLILPNERLVFVGGAGLAPEWTERALSTSEQRWVSACIYALTNKLGESVQVNLRGTHPKISKETEEELRTYTLHEGGFFGNIFAPSHPGYVCEGADSKKMFGFPIGRLRLCAQPSGETTVGGQPVSACGFIITGTCSSPMNYVVDGEQFNEVIHTWLSRD